MRAAGNAAVARLTPISSKSRKRSGAASVVVALAMASADIGTSAGGPYMRGGSDAVTIKPTARTDGCNMCPGMHTVVAHTGTGAHHRPDMTACGNAMLANARARTYTENMSARADTMLVDVHVRAHAQHMNAKIHRKGPGCEQGRHQGHGANSDGKLFHSGNTPCSCVLTQVRYGSSVNSNSPWGNSSERTHYCRADPVSAVAAGLLSVHHRAGIALAMNGAPKGNRTWCSA
jgi:hypothetical protein